MRDRRRSVRTLAAWALLVMAPTALHAQELRVTLLGTGGPAPEIDRSGPGTLVVAGGEKLLFDAGRGVSERLWQSNIRLGEIRGVFLTHLHSDHVVGLPDLWLTSLHATAFGGRAAPLEVWGPDGTREMLDALARAYRVDVKNRRDGAGLPEDALSLQGHEVRQGVVYERAGVTVTAFTVDHGTVAIAAFGYRVTYAGRSVVISGDTRPSENLVRFARGADVLIHEVMIARPGALRQSETARRVMGSHTSPEEVATILTKVKPRLAVFTHIGVMAAPQNLEAVTAEILPRVRTTYTGAMELGEDLMTIVVGETVSVRRYRDPPSK